MTFATVHGGVLRALALAAVLLAPFAALADKGEDWSPERLIPEAPGRIKTDGNLRASGDDDHIRGEAFLRTPLIVGPDGYLLFEGRGLVGRYWDFDDETFYQGTLGLAWRQRLDAANAFGLNGYLDFGGYDGFAGQGSLGLEYENVDAAARSIRLGGNLYLPFADYTEERDRARAPRLGADLYAGLGRQWGEHRLEGFVTGFHYFETDEAEPLWGGTAELEWRYEGFALLPEGSHFYLKGGVRYDSFEDDVSPLFGIGVSLALNPRPTTRDRVAEVRRNIAFGSAFVPIDYKPLPPAAPPAPTDCGPGNAPYDEAVGAQFMLDDGTGTPPHSAPPGTTILDILGIAAVTSPPTRTASISSPPPTRRPSAGH
jgi:hypothetical protein